MDAPALRSFIAAGVLFGFAALAKPQFIIFLAAGVGAAWAANVLYYRHAPHRAFVVVLLTMGALFAGWEIFVLAFAGPAGFGENLALLLQSSGSAALSSSRWMARVSLRKLVGWPVYGYTLFPALLYGVRLARRDRPRAQAWGTILILVVINAGWYIFASIGWLRYAFPALSLASLFVARMLVDVFEATAGWRQTRRRAARFLLAAWVAGMSLPQLWEVSRLIASSYEPGALIMARYLEKEIPKTSVIETWEPEIVFLTDHAYHFPSESLLHRAVVYVALQGPSPSQFYDFLQPSPPDYVLSGPFDRLVHLYSPDILARSYRRVASVGGYDLFQKTMQ
ncbi:MAG: hypothetical protein HY023_07620, partial [Chloroflexi bacterium]|nr:hypothetical protein [Chloroflexota bacterium]